ncbi:hypothetical protein [Bradyrhizobium sp. Leo121]|uniref:hypothetical protein n=1 Tax=Bradyrhizobium sp. Leo121 TaxID=1571195 RepID=UPI0013EF2E8D|nr:hypothetical protein [Bradyrhizobium sp. Leo121]
MRAALKGGSGGTTGTAIAGYVNVNTMVVAEICINFIRDILQLAHQRSDAVDMAGRPDV